MKENLSEEERRAHYNAADENDRLVINFRNINHTMRSLYEGKGSQKRILIVLLESGSITQQKLTERLGIQPGSASEVLAKLEKGGLITRTESMTDRRTTDVALTEQGRASAEDAAKQRMIRHEEMFSCMSDEEKSVLLGLLEKLNSDWEQRYREKENRLHKDGAHGHCHGRKDGKNPCGNI